MNDGSVKRVKLAGEYDFYRRGELRAALGGIDGSCTIELSCVTFGDSSFIAELAAVKNRLNGATVTLAGADKNMRRLLDVVGFSTLFRMVD